MVRGLRGRFLWANASLFAQLEGYMSCVLPLRSSDYRPRKITLAVVYVQVQTVMDRIVPPYVTDHKQDPCAGWHRWSQALKRGKKSGNLSLDDWKQTRLPSPHPSLLIGTKYSVNSAKVIKTTGNNYVLVRCCRIQAEGTSPSETFKRVEIYVYVLWLSSLEDNRDR